MWVYLRCQLSELFFLFSGEDGSVKIARAFTESLVGDDQILGRVKVSLRGNEHPAPDAVFLSKEDQKNEMQKLPLKTACLKKRPVVSSPVVT